MDEEGEPTAEVLVDDQWYPASILSWSGTAGRIIICRLSPGELSP